MVGLLVEAIKEQQKIIDNQQSATVSLTAVQADLQTENKNLKAEYAHRLKKIEEILGTKAEK